MNFFRNVRNATRIVHENVVENVPRELHENVFAYASRSMANRVAFKPGD